MTVTLPKPIAAYFEADGSAADCFADNAVVKDERRTHTGLAAITAWRAETGARYQYTATPFAVDEQDGRVVVTSHVVGNFPGSPIDLSYRFKLAGEKITELEILG